MNKIIRCAVGVLLMLLLPVFAFAENARIETVVPSSHTVTVVCGAGGSVEIDGSVYTGTNRFTVARHSGFALTAFADDDYALSRIISNHSVGMVQNGDGASIASVSRDVSITVAFRSTLITEPEPEAPANAAVPRAEPEREPEPESAPDGGTTVFITGARENFEVNAVVEQNVVNVDIDSEAFAALLDNNAEAEELSLNLSGVGEGVDTVVFNSDAVAAVNASTGNSDSAFDILEIVLPNAVVRFDAPALSAITEQAEDDMLTLNVKRIEPSALNDLQMAALGDAENAVIAEITLQSGSTVISDFKGGSVEVRLAYTPRDGEDTQTVTVWYVADDGTLEQLPCRYENNFVIFTVRHFSNYFIQPGTISKAPSSIEPGDDDNYLVGNLNNGGISFWYWFIPLIAVFTFVASVILRRINRRPNVG